MARSKVVEMAEAEAQRAEAEEPDDEEAEAEADDEVEGEGAEDTDEAQGEPEAVAEPLSIEAMQKALEREALRHAETLAGIFGDTFSAYEECPACFMLGFVAPESPVLDSTTQRCTRCRGYGVLITASVVPEHVNRQCPECMGNGYVPRVEAPAPAAAPPALAIPPMPVYNPVTNAWEVPPSNGPQSYGPAPGVPASTP